MAICWDTDDNGEIKLINGNPVLIDDKQELIRALDSRLRTSKGAFSMLPDVGMDTSWMVNGRFRDAEVQEAVKECIMQDERVFNVESIIIERHPEQATMNIDIVADTTLGQLNFKEVRTYATK